MESVLERMGLRSSSERDRLMGNVEGVERWKGLGRGVTGVAGVAETLVFFGIDVSDDHEGTGGRFGLGDTAIFLAG